MLALTTSLVTAAQESIGLDGIPYGALTPWGLLLIVILFIVLGKLVPRKNLEDVIHDRDEWRTAHRISETARQEQTNQLNELLEHARATDHFLRALPTAARAIQAIPGDRYGDEDG